MTSSPESATSSPPAAAPATPAPAKPARPRKEAPASRPPLFSGEPQPPTQQPPETPAAAPSPPPAAGAVSASESSPDDKPGRRRRGRDGSSDSPSSDTPPAPPARINVQSKAQLKKAIKAAVRVTGNRLHAVAADRDELADQAGLFLTDDEDQEGLSDPLANLAARHLGPGALNPDLGDALVAIVALFNYASKQLDIFARIRAARRHVTVDTAGQMQDRPEGAPAA